MGTATLTWTCKRSDGIDKTKSFFVTYPGKDDGVVDDEEKVVILNALQAEVKKQTEKEPCKLNPDSFQIKVVDGKAEQIIVPDKTFKSSVIDLLTPKVKGPLSGSTLTEADIEVFKKRPKDPAAQFLLCLGESKTAEEFDKCVAEKARSFMIAGTGIWGEDQIKFWKAGNGFPIRLPESKGGLIANEVFDEELANVLKRCPDKKLGESLAETYKDFSEAIRLASDPEFVVKHVSKNMYSSALTQGDPNFRDQTQLTEQKVGFVIKLLEKGLGLKGLKDEDALESVVIYNNLIRFYSAAKQKIGKE